MHTRYRGAALFVVVASFGFSIANAQEPTEFTVYGTNTYPDDVGAIQEAVASYDVVILSGSFDFGPAEFDVTPAGLLVIDRSVTLKGDEIAGATIHGGGAPLDIPNLWPVIAILASDVTIEGIGFSGATDTAIYVPGANLPGGSTATGITIQNNSIDVEWGGVVVFGGQGLSIQDNDIQVALPNSQGIYVFGRAVEPTDETMSITGNSIVAGANAIHLLYTGAMPIQIRGNSLKGGLSAINSHWTGDFWRPDPPFIFERRGPLTIAENLIEIGGSPYHEGQDAVMIWGWPVHSNFGGAPPPPYLDESVNRAGWGDNGPIEISENTVTCLPVPYPGYQFTGAIQIGRSGQGLNNALVTNNKLLGECTMGITKWPYGENNAIVGNDLSDLTTDWEQILVMAHDTSVAYNKFGPVRETAALMLWSVNGHPPVTPMPFALENCVIADNDYRSTGVPGWSEGMGAIMLASDVDLQWSSGEGTEVRNNHIFESGNFPEGSGGAKQQIFEFVGNDRLVHSNRIVGLSANYTSDPGIGELVRGMRRSAAPQSPGLEESEK